MAATNKPNNELSTKSQWPIVDKVAPWKEKETVRKIIKYLASPLSLPLALMSDLVNKGVNYAWSLKNIKVYPTNLKKIDLKASLQTCKDNLKSIWNKKIIKTTLTIGLSLIGSVGLYYLFSYVKPFTCKTFCLNDIYVCQNGTCYPLENSNVEIRFRNT